MGSVVAINLLTGKYVVGAASPQALYMYLDTFGKKAEPNCCCYPLAAQADASGSDNVSL